MGEHYRSLFPRFELSSDLAPGGSTEDGGDGGDENDDEDGGIIASILNSINRLIDWVKDIIAGIASLPEIILNGIKEIFIPDSEDIKASFNEMTLSIKQKIGLPDLDILTDDVESSPITNIDGELELYGIGKIEATFLDVRFLTMAVNKFRPLIQAVFYVMLFLYNIRQFLTLIGQDSGIKEADQ